MDRKATLSSLPKRPWPFLVAKVFTLQILFYSMVKQGPIVDPLLLTAITIGLLLINFLVVRRLIQLKYYLIMMVLFYASGFIQDTILSYFHKIDFGSPTPPLYISCLWLLFLGYYGDVFRKMLDFPIWLSALLGSAGGTLAYYRGFGSHAYSMSADFYPIVATIWAVYMPCSLRLFRHFIILSQSQNPKQNSDLWR